MASGGLSGHPIARPISGLRICFPSVNGGFESVLDDV